MSRPPVKHICDYVGCHRFYYGPKFPPGWANEWGCDYCPEHRDYDPPPGPAKVATMKLAA